MELPRQVRSQMEFGNEEPSCSNQTSFSHLKNSFNLFATHSGKPFDKVIHAGSVFKVLEKRFHRNTRSFEDPCSAYHVGMTFN